MATILTPGAAAVDVVQLMNGNFVVNTFCFTKDDETDFAYEDIVDLVDTIVHPMVLTSDWTGLRVTTWSTILLRGRSLADPTIAYESTVGLPVSGTSTSGASNQDALVVSLYTAENTRNTRGRVYLAGISKGFITLPGLWHSDAVDGMRAVINNMKNFAQADNYNLVVVSTRLAGSPRATGITTEVVNVVARNIPGSMATRRIGRGS